MSNSRVLLKVIATTLVVTTLGFLLLLDARNSSGGSGTTLGRGYSDSGAGDYGSSLGPSRAYEALPDLTGAVNGSVVDDSNSPIRGIGVELIPLDKVGDQQWHATKTDWTNEQGQYLFSKVHPGEYIVAMQMRGAPDGRHPFAGAYYPGVDDETDADHIYVLTGQALDLHPVRLRRLDTLTVKVNVEFDDGSRPS